MPLVHIEETFDIAGVTPQQCFDYITDVDNGSDWNSFVKSATAEGPIEVGRVIHAKIQFLIPLPFEITSTVTTCEEPGAYTITSTFPFTAHLGGRFADDGAGGTEVVFSLEMEPTKFFPVPKIVLKKALQKQFDKDRKTLQASLQALSG